MIDVSAVRARLDAATPAPWETRDAETLPGLDGLPSLVVFTSDGDEVVNTCTSAGCGPILRQADAYFIAHARSDVADLCDEVERLRAALAEIRALHRPSKTGFCKVCFTIGNGTWQYVPHPCPSDRLAAAALGPEDET